MWKVAAWKNVKLDFLFAKRAEDGMWQTVQACAVSFLAFQIGIQFTSYSVFKS